MGGMVYLRYMLSELRRRKGRTFLTAAGLGVGVAIVIAVGALSSGLDRAQQQVLQPLTGVGTDMSVTRPIFLSSSSATNQNGFPQLSEKERQQLEKENGDQRVGFGNLKAGEKFTRTSFRSTQVSFPTSNVDRIAKLDGVAAAAGGLTLTLTTVSGTVPEQSATPPSGGFRGGGAGGFNGPRSIGFTSLSITGVDIAQPAVAPVTPGQLTKGSYLTQGDARQAIVSLAYARSKNVTVGDTLKISGKTYTIVGVVKAAVGGTTSDVYVKLDQLQALSGRAGRVNAVYVRADSASQVDAVAAAVRKALPGASVTTAKALASQVTGSLTDAKNLTDKLGTVLELIGLIGAIVIASLLTLSSVTKRVRELGTLKAIGWSQRLVVRQVTGESLLQGLLGGAFGVALGIGAAALITALAPTLKASLSAASNAPALPGPFGQGAVSQAASEAVQLTAHVSTPLVLLAVALAALGGLVAGAVGALRVSRLRPADALRHID
jgi:putative ABC transport system permease protein